jgi:hypothetical protein
MPITPDAYAVGVGSGGALAHVEINDHGFVVRIGAGGAILSTLTKTGITPPVASLKGRCLRTTHMSAANYTLFLYLHTSQNRSDFSRVSRDGDPRISSVAEDGVEHRLVSDILVVTTITLISAASCIFVQITTHPSAYPSR